MFSLATPIERQAALAALTAYIEVLDGVRIQPVDNPACGAISALPVETHATAGVEVVTPPAAQVFGTVTLPAVNPEVLGAAFGVVTTPPTPFPYPTVEQASAGPLRTVVNNAIDPILAAVTTPPAPAGTVEAPPSEFDVNGTLWCSTIHSSTRTKNKDGTWRVKRNTGAKDDVPPAPPVVATTPPAPPVVVATPPAPPAPVAAVAPLAAPPAAGPTTFKELMTALNPLMSGGKIDFQSVASACQMNGVAALPALNANPSAIPAVWATIQGML